MITLQEDVAEFVEGVEILSQGSRILVAVSGGVDSMVLLHLLHQLAPARKWGLVAAHLNHQLRGRSSDADQRFVESKCKRLGVPCVIGSRDTKALAKRQKLSIEMAAREARHRFLAQMARRRRCSVVALAHHANDQAELVLLRLLRGSGSEGLGGMSLVGPSPADAHVRLMRPLLQTSREEIEAFAKERGIRFREDRSNANRRFLRNRIRHELLPLLRQNYQPAIDRVLARTASILSADAQCISELALAWLESGSDSFEQLPLAVKRRVVQLQAIKLGISLEFETCDQLIVGAVRVVNVPGGGALTRSEDGKLTRVARHILRHSNAESRVTLADAGEVWFAGRHFEWCVVDGGRIRKPRSHPGMESFDAERVGGVIRLRHWRAGDRFQPIGMETTVKLQDLYTNLKVPLAERRQRVVAEAESGEILWVEGLRIGERFKVGPNTRKRLIWRWNC